MVGTKYPRKFQIASNLKLSMVVVNHGRGVLSSGYMILSQARPNQLFSE